MTGLNTLSPANKLLLTGLTVKLAPSATWTNISDLGQELTGFDNLTFFLVDATGAYTTAGGNPQATVAFHTDVNGASPKTIVTALASVDKDSADSWTYYFSSAPLVSLDVSAVTLNSDEASAFLGAIGSGDTAKSAITSVTMKLDPTFGNGSLTFDANNDFTSLTTITVHRNGAADSGVPVSLSISNTPTAAISIVDPTSSDADAVVKTNASSWLAYLTDALSGAVTALDLTDDNLVLGTQGQATALSAALDALEPTLKAKVATLKLKASANVTISATLTTAGGFSDLTAIELDKPAANTITVSSINTNAQLRIADLANVKRTVANDWLAYIQYLMKDLGAVTNFDLDMTASPLADGELQAFVDSLITISNNANSSDNRDKIQKVRLKAAPGAWTSNITDLGNGWNGFMNNIDTFTVDVTGATVSGEQLYISFSADLTVCSDYTKAFITDLSSVDKDNADAWEFYLNYLTKDGAAALDLSVITLSYVQLNALDNGLGTFSAAAGNGARLQSIHIKVSGAAGASNYAIAADLDAQTLIDNASKFIVDVSEFNYGGTQATVSHTGGTPKPVELRVSSASNLYRDSAQSWNAYLNALYVGGIPAATTVNLTASSDTYLRNQTDVAALMSAIESRGDKANIDTLNVRLAPGSVGSDITLGTGVTGINPTMAITVSGATNNGTFLTSSDIHYAGSFTSTGKTVTQAFATSVADKGYQLDWTQYLTYQLSARSDGGLGQVAIIAPTLTSSAELTALMGALNGLSNELKASIQRLHLDVSHANFNGALTLGTGVSGLSNLQEVTYVRASAQANATAAVVGSGDFSGKLQRLRTAWNADTIASAATVEAYLRYKLMDPEMGGSPVTLLDLTSQTLDSTQAGYLNTALGALPDDLSFRITELRLSLNAADPVTFDAAGLRNLSAVKYFQTGAGALTWTDASSVGFGSATRTQFRAALGDVSDKTSQTQWSHYINYVTTSVDEGGLGLTTFDLRSITLTSTQVVPFLAALNAHSTASSVTSLKLKLDPTFGAASLNLSGYSNLTSLGSNTVEIHRNGAVDSGAPITLTYGGSFTDANVKIVDPETTTTADKDNSIQQWLEYLTYTIHTVGLTNGLLTIAPGDAFTSQAQVYKVFDALEALDPALKAEVDHIHIRIPSITSGNMSLASTGDAALTGFDNLTAITYDRANIDADVAAIIADLTAALDSDATLDAIPTWIFADEPARDAAISTAVADGSVTGAIVVSDANALKTALVTQLSNGITFPASNVCDSAVDTAAADVDVTVDGDQKTTLATALTPFRSTGKISGINSALSTAFTDGGTTGLGTLAWLKSSWTGYANHAAVMTAVLADGTVISEIARHNASINDIKTAVKNKLYEIIIPTSGSLTTLLSGIDFTILSGWGTSISTFKASLDSVLVAQLATTYPQYVTTGTNYVNTLSYAALDGWTWTNNAGGWDTSNSGAALKTALQARLLTQVLTNDEVGATITLDPAIDAAFTAADAGDALTDGTATWVRPTAGIEEDLTTSLQSSLSAFNWYTGNAATQAAAAVTAGDVANQTAATIISNIKTWLSNNVVRPTSSSVFTAGVSAAVDAITLNAVATNVTTYGSGTPALSRYRVNASDVTNKEDGGQWTEYLLHKLSPVAEGGLYSTTIDISATPLGNDQKNNFTAALSSLPDELRTRITSIKIAAADNTLGDLDGGGKAYNDNLKIILIMNDYSTGMPTLSTANGQKFYAEDGSTELTAADVIEYRITSAPAVTASATEWERWLNHKLSSTFGGDGVTTLDLSGTHSFASQAQLNAFFTGLEALGGTNGTANKNVLTSLTLKLASGDFGASSARIGYTGSAAVTDLNAAVAITVKRNGAQNGGNTYDPLVTINHSDIDAISSVDGVTVDNTDAVDVDSLSSAPEWLEYLNSTLTAAGAGYTVDLTGAGLQLAAGSSDNQATALFNALQALDSTLKAKVATLKIKLAAGDHGAGALALSGTLNNAAGFTALSRIIVDVTDAETNAGGTQKIINWGGLTTEAGVKKVMWVTSLASVDFDSANATDSWHAYLNYITRTSTAALDTSAVNSGNGLTVAEAGYLFTALGNFSAANDNPARLTSVTVKLVDNADAGSGTLTVNQDLSNLSGVTSIIVNATGALAGGDQVAVSFSGGTFHANTTTTEARVISLASVDRDSADSWAYYLNYLNATDGNIETIDLSARDLYFTDESTTQANVTAFFTALEARADRTTVKDIFFDISGANNLNINVGAGSSTLTALTHVGIKRHAGAGSSFTAQGDVGAANLAVINSSTGTLGANGTVAQWKGYLGYLLENAAHGGAYSGSNPVALNLAAAPALEVASLAVLQAIENAIAQLPARLKARISTLLIKTTDTNINYQSGGYLFGEVWTSGILDDLSQLKAVIINSCTNGGTDPGFAGSGDFFNRSSISKIMYHTTAIIT